MSQRSQLVGSRRFLFVLALCASAVHGQAAVRSQASSSPDIAARISTAWSESSKLSNAAPGDERADGLARSVEPLVATLWSTKDAGPTGLAIADEEHLLELACFRIGRIGTSAPTTAANEFAQVWTHLQRSPPRPPDSVASLTALCDLRSRLFAALQPAVERLDPELRTRLAEQIRATPITEEAAQAFKGEALAIDQRLRASLRTRGAVEAPKDPSKRVKSIRLLEEDDATVVGAVVVLDDGRELSLRDETEIDGVRLDNLQGAALEPQATLWIDGVPLCCYPRSGIVLAPWPTASRRAWLETQFGTTDSATWKHVSETSRWRIARADRHMAKELAERIRRAGDDVDSDIAFSAQELDTVTNAMTGVAQDTARVNTTWTGDEFQDEQIALEISLVTDPSASIVAAWVGGKAVIAPTHELQERAWLSLAWAMTFPPSDREMALGWARGEIEGAMQRHFLQRADDAELALPRVPELEKLLAQAALLDARVAYASLACDGGASAPDHSALLLRLLPIVGEFSNRGERGPLTVDQQPPAPSGVGPELQPLLRGWLRADPNPSDPRHVQLAGELAPFARWLETIVAGDPLDLFSSLGERDYGARYRRASDSCAVFELVAFRIGLLAERDLGAALREFETAWTAVPRLLSPLSELTLERRDTARRVLLRPLLAHRSALSQEQRRAMFELVSATNPWGEAADAFEGEATTRCQSIREKVAAAAGASTTPDSIQANQLEAMNVAVHDGSMTGVVLVFPGDVRVELAPGQSAHGFTLVELSDAWLNPIARLRSGDERIVSFPTTGFCCADWPPVSRSVWFDARYGAQGTAYRDAFQEAVERAAGQVRGELTPELLRKVDQMLRDPALHIELTPDELLAITEARPWTDPDGLMYGPKLAEWLAPGVIIAGEVDAEERLWRTLAQLCRFEDAQLREESFAEIGAQWAAVRQPWMRIDLDPVRKIQAARESALVVQASAALLAN